MPYGPIMLKQKSIMCNKIPNVANPENEMKR